MSTILRYWKGLKPIGLITPLDLTRNQGHTADEDREAIETVLDVSTGFRERSWN